MFAVHGNYRLPRLIYPRAFMIKKIAAKKWRLPRLTVNYRLPLETLQHSLTP